MKSDLRNWNVSDPVINHCIDTNTKSLDDDTRKINQSLVNIILCETNSDDTSELIDEQCDDTPASDTFDNTSNCDLRHESLTRCSAPSNHTESESLKDKEMNNIIDFPVERDNEGIRNEIRERNRGEKLQSEAPTGNSPKEDTYASNIKSSVPSNQKKERVLVKITQVQNSISPEVNSNNISEQIVDTSFNNAPNSGDKEINDFLDQKVKEKVRTSTTVLKIPYNQKVEQGLTHELSVCAEDNDIKNNAIHGFSSDKPFNIQIPELSLEVILTESSRVTAQNIADLFNIAMKVRQKEILYWYCYYKTYEDRIGNIRSIEKIDDKSARTSVYNEIKSLLPDITDNAHVIEPSISNDSEKLPETEVSVSSNPAHDHTYFCNKTLEQYPNLYREFSSENADYYGITDETLCPLCELNHEDEEGVEGRYEAGSYYIKCEQREIEITA
ncbi:15213_t:CDS:2 [Entrophospora sp. SA101]|nr:15213_t:CDS:2 [Entrophospora sp. SA101]